MPAPMPSTLPELHRAFIATPSDALNSVVTDSIR
jgi:hypothetical protein